MGNVDQELSQISKEYRELILDKLNKLELGQLQLIKNLADVTTNYAQNSRIDTLETKIETLQAFKSRLIGISLGVNAILLFLGWLIQSYIFSHH